MKIFVDYNTYAPYNIRAELNEYDAIPPLNTLQVGIEPREIHQDRLAIACYLLFGDFASGEFQVPKACSPAAAEAIEQDSSPVQLRPAPIEYHPKALPLGSIAAQVHFDIESAPSQDGVIAVLPSDKYNGSMVGHRQLFVPSNAFLFDALSPRNNSIRARLAVAVLLAEELEIDRLTISCSGISDEEQLSLIRLLSSCRLGVDFNYSAFSNSFENQGKLSRGSDDEQ